MSVVVVRGTLMLVAVAVSANIVTGIVVAAKSVVNVGSWARLSW
jgi:hypothetical protein